MNGCQSSMAMLIDNCLLIGGLLDESVAGGTREVERRKQFNSTYMPLPHSKLLRLSAVGNADTIS